MKHFYVLQSGLETAFINQSINSNLAFRPEFVSNDCKRGKRIISSLEQELMNCEEFFISVAFITLGGITPLLQILKELEQRGIKGKIFTTDYQEFYRIIVGSSNMTASALKVN